MYYDTQIIYGSTVNQSTFTLDGWLYYKTPTGRTKRRSGETIESVDSKQFADMKERYEDLMGFTVEC